MHFAWQAKDRKYMEYVAMNKEVSVSSLTKGSDSLNIDIHYANEAHPSIVEYRQKTGTILEELKSEKSKHVTMW